MSIPFTQFMRPDGRPVQTSIDMSKEIEDKAFKLIDAGYFFESEVLQDEGISLTCTKDDENMGIELCENGPEVEQALKRLVEELYKFEFEK